MSLIMDSVIGHRGVAALAPENTLAGIRKAVEESLSWIELDVTLLGDDSAVMFHDPRIGRTTSGRGHVKKQALEQLQALDAGSWFSESFAGEKVPTFREALELVKELGLSLNLELKPNRCDLKLLVAQVVSVLKELSFPEDRLLVSSFNHKALVFYRAKAHSRIGCLYESLPRNWLHSARQVKAKTIHLNGRKLKKHQAEAVKSAGYELYCYTVNDRVLAKKLKGFGVDGVFSDQPSVL